MFTVLAAFPSRRHDHAACVAEVLRAAEDICREGALNLTPLRRRVLELVWDSHAPVRAYDLLDELRTERRGAAPPTVYRALEFLQAHGFVHRLDSLNAYVGCAQPGTRHAGQFLICGACRTVAELDDPAITEAVNARAGAVGFEVAGQTVEISGLCAACAKSSASQESRTIG